MYDSDIVLLYFVNEFSFRFKSLSLIYYAYVMRCSKLMLA
jgi:hypothetical protein